MKTNENASKVREKKIEQVLEKLDGKVTLYDPPEGWKWGFPKPYKPIDGEALEDTLMRDGYPKEMAQKWARYCRFIGDIGSFPKSRFDR